MTDDDRAEAKRLLDAAAEAVAMFEPITLEDVQEGDRITTHLRVRLRD